MKIWTNTKTLNGLIDDLSTDAEPQDAEVALIGGKAISLDEFPRLRGIFKCGIGRDNVPEAECARRGIVCGFPSPETADIIYEETASFSCYLILSCIYAEIGDFSTWTKVKRASLSKREVLIIGTGNIGSRVAARMEKLCCVVTYDITENSPDELEPLMRRADCVSLNVPLNDQTKGIIDREKLGWMKDGASLVNTARAAVVSEEALFDELVSGRLRAAFDVFWQEPYRGRLLSLPPDRFIVTPHVASNCREFILGTADDFRAFLQHLEQI